MFCFRDTKELTTGYLSCLSGTLQAHPVFGTDFSPSGTGPCISQGVTASSTGPTLGLLALPSSRWLSGVEQVARFRPAELPAELLRVFLGHRIRSLSAEIRVGKLEHVSMLTTASITKSPSTPCQCSIEFHGSSAPSGFIGA